MGVKGLWQLLECVGRPVTLESLENKILGVDASLILHQSIKGMRDKHGNPVRSAHLVGLFNRVCKLLYYRIKPVFVFDGGVPHLKKKTLAARKERRFKAVHGSNKAAEKIVKNYLKAKALETVTGRKSNSAIRSKSPREPDVFELAPMPSTAAGTTGSTSSSEDEGLENSILDQFRSQQLEDTYQDPAAINVDSEDFKALPAEIQHELIKEIKEERKWMDKHHMPRQARDFSQFQLQGVLKRGKLNQRLNELSKEMNSRNSGDLAGVTPQDSLGDQSAVKSQKILSEDTAHYILIKNNEQAAEKDQQEIGSSSKDFSNEGGFFREDQNCEVVSWTNPRPKPAAAQPKAPSFDIPELCSSDSEILSPLVDVTEAGLSPKSLQSKNSAFSFSPTKDKKLLENTLLNLRDNIKYKEEIQNQGFQSISSLGSLSNQTENCSNEGPEMEKLQREHEEMLGGSSAKDNDKDDALLTQIFDKKKELDELIKKWENSRNQKPVIDLTSSALEGNNAVEDIDMHYRSSQSLEAVKPSEKEQDCSNIVETENSPSILVTVDQISEQEKNVDAVCVSESESETSSVEEMAASVNRKDGVSDGIMSDDGTVLEVDSSEVVSVSQAQVKVNIQGEKDTCTVYNVEDHEKCISLSSDVDMETTCSAPVTTETDQEGIQRSPESTEIPVVKIKETLAERNVGIAVDEQEAGPSGLPVEWQGATMEGLEEIQLDIETEQQSLATEQARQNRMAATVSSEMFTECQELLQLFGVPYLVSPMEAEAQCAALDVLGLTEGSITDDSDIFLFGGTRVYKNIFNQQKHAELYGSVAVQRNLALNRSSLICLAFLTGSDYTEGIQGVGPVGAMELLHEFSGEGLEGLKKFKMWHDEAQKRTKVPQETKVKRKMRSVVLPGDFPSEEVFDAYLHPVVDESTERFEWGKPDLHSLRLFASDKLGWPAARTDELLLPVLKQLNRDETQMKIDQFFQVKFQETRNIKSKRIRRVLNRTFNPSSNSDSEDEDKSNGKEKKSTDEMPSKNTKQRQARKTKRTSKEIEENEGDVNRPKRSKTANIEGDASPSAANRSKGTHRGRGRGRTQLRKNEGGVNSRSGLTLSVEITPLELSNQENSFHVSRENHKETSRRVRNQRAVAQHSASAENKTEGLTTSVRVNSAKAGNKQRGSPEDLTGNDNSTSESTDSEGDDENIYVGPKAVSLFRRAKGRGRDKGNGPGRGKDRKSLVEQENSESESSGNEDNEKNIYAGPKPSSVFRRGRGRGRGRGKGNEPGRANEDKSLAEQENSSSESSGSEDNEDNVYAGPKPVSVFRRGRGRGKKNGRGKGR